MPEKNLRIPFVSLNRSVLVIGCGNIGRWHIKGLENSKHDVTVFVADRDPNAIQALETFQKVEMRDPSNCSINAVGLSGAELSKLPKLDLVICATTAKNREELVSYLNARIESKFWLIEKPLEQSLIAMAKISQTMSGQRCFVNHPRRLAPLHIKLRSELKNKGVVDLTYSSPEFGIACNASHFIDLVNWFTSALPSHIETGGLSRAWHETVREGFFDVTGILKIFFSDGSSVLLDSSPSVGQNKFQINLNQELFCLVSEQNGVITYSGGGQKKSEILGQSALTGIVLDELCENGFIDLPSLALSVECNRLLVNCLLTHWNDFSNSNHASIPIT